MTIIDKKRELRGDILKLSLALSSQEKMAQSEAVFRRVEGLDEFRRAETVAMFWSMNDELPTHDVAERWAITKRIVLPVVSGGEMFFVEYSPDAEMQKGQLGVLQPLSGVRIEPRQIDLVIVPGVAFDSSGRRLGRGKGYYDKFLEGLDASTIGVCMKHQMVDVIPCEDHDKRVERVVCE